MAQADAYADRDYSRAYKLERQAYEGTYGTGTTLAGASLPAKQAAVLAATQRPGSTLTLGQPSGPPAWAEIPSWALVGTVDRVILPATQLFMAERAGARIVKVKASHLSMISQPGAVTRLIVAADRATR
jgi:pimeloyl-ACP methyl ester carboxylesterase